MKLAPTTAGSLRWPALALAALAAACGGNDSSAPAPEAGGTKRALAATTTLAVPINQAADPMLDNLVIPGNAATQGMWGPLQSWPMNAIHVALLPDGKVLSYGAPQNTDSQDGRTFSVWTPSLGFGTNAHAVSFEAGRVNSFCSTADWLGDGRLLISGGNTARGSQLYSPTTLTAANDSTQLADDRWYATMLTLPDGRTVMLGGIDPYTEGMYQNPDAAIQNGQVSMTPELYTPGIGWRSLTGAISRDAFGPDNLRASYPRAWVAPNGEIFGISADRLWALDVFGNNGTGALRVLGAFKTGPSNTSPVNTGATSSAVMFAPGRILQVGGNGGFNGDGFTASNMATVIDINALGSSAPVVTETSRMAFARRFPSTVVLPNGEVLVTGGTRVGNNGGADAVYAGEIWNPATGTWRTVASAARIRVYHSGAMLMPNGTVISLGGGTPGPQYSANAEIYYPPYLFQQQGSSSVLAARPRMTGINALTHTLGSTVQVEMLDSSTVSRLVLIKAGTVTHSFNNGQRFHELTFTQSGDRLSATLPGSANLLPPGHYQLIALNAAGVPSKAVIVTLKPAAADLPRNVPLVLGATHVADAAIGVDGAGLAVLQALPASPSPAQLASSQFIARAGLADAACVSLELAAQPGRWLRHAGYRLQLGTDDGSALFDNDATFCPEPGLAGHSVSLRSKNFPTHVLRERNGELWIDVQASDAPFRNSATWNPRVIDSGGGGATPLPSFNPLPAAPVPASSGTASWAPGLEASGLEFSWSFGDGSPATAWGSSSAGSRTYAAPGVYTVTLTARNAAGQTASTSFVQAVYAAPTATAARSSSPMLLEPRSGQSTRLWVVNPDNNSVAVIDTATNGRVAEITVGSAPRTIARAPNGEIWVVNRDSASISVINASTLAVARTTALPRASQPYAVLFAPNGGAAYVTLEAAARLLRLDPANGSQTGAWATGATPRHLAISGDSARLLVSRFVTAPLPGEGTASISTTGNVGGEVWLFNTATMALANTVWLRHSDRTDTEIQGSGIPNYLGAPAISADGRTAWVPGKQDNVKRGVLRNTLNLDFQNTVRAVSSRIDLAAATPVELTTQRIDHDNASVASAAAFDPTGAYLFVALETSRQIAVVDAARGLELVRIESGGFAPQGLIVSADGRQLYASNFMSRSVAVIDLTPLMTNGSFAFGTPTLVGTVGTERLTATVLRGKQLFYDARDPRLARDAYMSCASCHNDGGHDGRVWDLTGQGEGLRNTISLRGRGGMGHGRLHWSSNFNEVQDFEAQIRTLAGGTGLMTDSQYFTGTRAQPLGDNKAGISTDLDALAAYVASLNAFAPSPGRTSAGALSAAGTAGRTVFVNQQCASCHSGANYTRSVAGSDSLADVGTVKPSSGKRLNGTLSGIDVPTLRDVAHTAPYLHDGSAATLEAAITAHVGLPTLAAADLTNLAQYLREIGNEETSAPGPATNGAGLLGTYYNGVTLSGTPLLTRIEGVNFSWGNNRPGTGLPADNFSVRWTGTVNVPTSGTYRFRTISDDGVRLWVGGTQRINNWTDHGTTTNTSSAFTLSAGNRSITLEYYEKTGGSTIQLQWLVPGSSTYVAVPVTRLNAQ